MTERQGLLEHLNELRTRLVKSAAALVVGAVIAFFLRNWIFDLLAEPWNDLAAEEGFGNLVFFRPTEAFSLMMRLSLFGGAILASPVIIWQTWAFTAPGLTKRERRWVVPTLAVLTVLFVTGVVVGYWALGKGLGFLIEFGEGRLDATIGGDFYLSFAMRFILVFGLAFEFPVFLFLAAALGMVSSERLRRGRRWAIVLIVVVGAVITPSGDPLTLMLLATPLYVLYEVVIALVRWVLRK